MDATATIDFHYLERTTSDLLFAGLKRLIDKGHDSGHWENDMRATADGLLTLHTCLTDASSGKEFLFLRKAAAHFLSSEMLDDNRNEYDPDLEVWDVAVSMIALLDVVDVYPDGRRAIQAGLNLLQNRFRLGNDNWYDEPWESLWSMLALQQLQLTNQYGDLTSLIMPATRWLTNLINEDEVLINWHYSALFLLFAQRSLKSSCFAWPDDLPSHLREKMGAMERRMLREFAGDYNENKLWTKELWSNSLCLWALLENGVPTTDTTFFQRVVDWYARQDIGRESIQTEDLAFSCIALFKLFRYLQEHRPLAEAVNGSPSTRLEAEEIKRRLAVKLSLVTEDYFPLVPIWETTRFRDYITLNIRKNHFFGAAIGLGTILLTLGLVKTTPNSTLFHWLAFGSGALATFVTIFGVSIRDLFTKSN